MDAASLSVENRIDRLQVRKKLRLGGGFFVREAACENALTAGRGKIDVPGVQAFYLYGGEGE